MTAAAHQPNRVLARLCLLSAAWAFSFGLEAPLASLWLRDAGGSPALVGWNSAGYYLGLLLAAALTPALMRRWGTGCPILGLVVSGLTVAAFPFADSVAGWFVIRLLNGAAGALALVPLESLVNHNAPAARRARDFGCYALAVVLGMAAGELAGWHLYADWPRASFVLGGAVAVLAAGLVPGLPAPAAEPVASRDVRRAPLPSWTAGACSGFLEAGLVHLLPLYLVCVGLADAEAGWLMAALLVGVIVWQVPIGWLADRFGRHRVLVLCYLAVAAGMGLAPLCRGGAQAAVLIATGAFAGAFYPLGLAILGERLPPAAIPAGNSAYLAVNCLGSLVSQPLIGLRMEQEGPAALFPACQAAVVAALGVSVLAKARRRRRRDAPSTSAAAATRAPA